MNKNLINWKRHIVGKMSEMKIKDFSNTEICRVFKGCVAEHRLIEITGLLLSQNSLSMDEILV